MRRLLPITLALVAALGASDARAQSGSATPAGAARGPAPGTFRGTDSLDATKEGRAAGARQEVAGTAEWTIELDSLDLRPKFTIRVRMAHADSGVLVIRAVDSLPPRAGRYEVVLTATGTSHADRRLVHASFYTVEGGVARDYVLGGMHRDSIWIDSRAASAEGAVAGRFVLLGNRYADARPGQLLRDWVWRSVGGAFVATPARERYPRIRVTAEMQEQALRRALEGFAITHSGAINGDGDADSTRSTHLARQFIESRWRDAALIEAIHSDSMAYHVRLRGRLVPIVCEIRTPDEEIVCERPRPDGRRLSARPHSAPGS